MMSAPTKLSLPSLRVSKQGIWEPVTITGLPEIVEMYVLFIEIYFINYFSLTEVL